MIISASRRTDIPAFFSEWFMNRIREGYCCTVNPYNKNQISNISLKPESVNVIVFWTKNPEPLIKHLSELNEKGYKYYFQYTLTPYSKHFEPFTPIIEKKVETFIKLSEKIGKDKVIWRYDPIIFTSVTDYEFHYTNFIKLIDRLGDNTGRAVISIVDDYRGARGRLKELEKIGIKLNENAMADKRFKEMIGSISSYAKGKGLEIFSCAEVVDLNDEGIKHGMCIDADYIKEVFNIDVNGNKDKGQRKECGCVESKDIGVYDTCPHRCKYCYANRSDALVLKNLKGHLVNSPSLLGWYEKTDKSIKNNKAEQISFLD
jgi:DNA repair photolyase